eukprot:3009098-Pleurochrysis_carterae.AAC.1
MPITANAARASAASSAWRVEAPMYRGVSTAHAPEKIPLRVKTSMRTTARIAFSTMLKPWKDQGVRCGDTERSVGPSPQGEWSSAGGDGGSEGGESTRRSS